MSADKNFIIDLIKTGECPYVPYLSVYKDNYLASKNIHLELYNDAFINFNNIRYTIEDDKIIEYNIDFYRLPKLKFPIKVNGLDIKELSYKTKLHELFLILRFSNIDYSEIKNRDRDYLFLQTSSLVNIFFDLERGTLYKIGKLEDSFMFPTS